MSNARCIYMETIKVCVYLTFILLAIATESLAAPVDTLSANVITFTVDGENVKIPYSRNYALTIEDQRCFAEEIYEDNSGKINLLRDFRDQILSGTPEGREIIRLYYEWSPIIVHAMEEDKERKGELNEMIDGVLGLIEGVGDEFL